jgi:hypothetical protein
MPIDAAMLDHRSVINHGPTTTKIGGIFLVFLVSQTLGNPH